MNIEQLKIEFEVYRVKQEEWYEKGFIRIGDMRLSGDTIFLGVENNNMDEIWISGDGTDTNKYVFFNSNIFELFSSIREYYTDKDLREYS